MKIVPFYIELASDDDWQYLEKFLKATRICFFTSEPLEGMTLEQVEQRICYTKNPKPSSAPNTNTIESAIEHSRKMVREYKPQPGKIES